MDLEGSGLDSRVSPGFTCFLTFCLNVTFPRKFRRIRVLRCTSEFMADTILIIGSTST